MWWACVVEKCGGKLWWKGVPMFSSECMWNSVFGCGRLLSVLSLCVVASSCDGAGMPEPGPAITLPQGESHWSLQLRRGQEKEGVSVQFFPSAAGADGSGAAQQLAAVNTLTYRLFLEMEQGRLHRCAAKEARGEFVTTTCAIEDDALTISIGQPEKGQIVMRLRPDASAASRRWSGTATMRHPALPMDVKICTVEMVAAGESRRPARLSVTVQSAPRLG